MNLNNLLDDVFGGKKKVTSTTSHQNDTSSISSRGMYISKDEGKDLIYALTAAINSIKNKKDVLAKNEDSTRYEHVTRWRILKRKFKNKFTETFDE